MYGANSTAGQTYTRPHLSPEYSLSLRKESTTSMKGRAPGRSDVEYRNTGGARKGKPKYMDPKQMFDLIELMVGAW